MEGLKCYAEIEGNPLTWPIVSGIEHLTTDISNPDSMIN